MTIVQQLYLIAIGWILCAAIVYRSTTHSRDGSTGLPFAFVLAMTFLHIGFATYLWPGYTHVRYDAFWYLDSLNYTIEMVRDGALASLLMLVGLALSCLALRGGASVNKKMPIPASRNPLISNLLALASLGFVLGFVPLSGVQSISLVLRGLAIVTICMALWIAYRRQDWIGYYRSLAISGLIPLVYLIAYGFLSYAFVAAAIIIAFIACSRSERRRRWVLVLRNFGLFYFSLSAFVSWMQVRDYLRSVIWGDYANISREAGTVTERFSAILQSLSKVSLFDPSNPIHLDLLNVRLNYNIQIGKMMYWHEMHPGLQLNGSSLIGAVFAWVPRFIWPGKPTQGGNLFVSEHTGMTFSAETAIASGPAFEFTANFGLWGALLGGLVFGALLRLIDRRASLALRRADYAAFVMYFGVGVSFINPNSQVIFIFSAAVTALVVGYFVRFWIDTAAQSRERSVLSKSF